MGIDSKGSVEEVKEVEDIVVNCVGFVQRGLICGANENQEPIFVGRCGEIFAAQGPDLGGSVIGQELRELGIEIIINFAWC